MKMQDEERVVHEGEDGEVKRVRRDGEEEDAR